ncbi:hypothetical protein WA026_000543 [Henosepilachna vigintioctopunctata]|uniref:C2H2-type domain-containing protein n=1 Tax=Henosepilachna vigintioctopunctata TaxID=420089 RepID=A0AAW1V0S4_9CUCU
MNFSPFGVPISSALPIATQFQAGKITQNVTTANGQVVGVLQGGENGVHYIRPIEMNTFALSPHANQANGVHQQQAQTLITLPITMPGAKPGDPQQTVQIQVLNPQPMSPPSPGGQQKFLAPIPIPTFGQGATVLTVAYNGNQEGIQIVDGQHGIPEGMTVVAAIQPQDIQLIHTTEADKHKEMLPVALIKNEIMKDESGQQDSGTSITAIPAQYLQNTTVQEYLQKMQQNAALPLSLQQFLKFNTPGIKQEQITDEGVMEHVSISTEMDPEQQLVLNQIDYVNNEENVDDPEKSKKKKKYKKKPAKPKKPKPGQVHIATALDGTTLFCCPECHMAYPEKELLEQHLVGHKIERRFICDICGAGLKRKEHLERHKLGHNPERPFVCSICMKGFKRKEHLNLHFVIHSGEKTEVCGECGKGFYRKDHLRKHQRSHVTKRAKELAERQNLLAKEGTTQAQVTIQMPTQQLQIPVQIQVPHHIQVTDQQDDENSQMSQQLQMPVQIQVPQHHIQVGAQQDEENSQVSTVVLPSSNDGLTIIPN